MAKSISVNPKMRGRPKTTGKGMLIGVRLLDEPLAAIDAWIDQQNDPGLSRPEAIRRLVELGLAGAATGRPKKSAASPKPSELAAAQIDRLIDKSVPVEEQETRKRRLLKGPSEFREVRVDRKKPK